jgi:hypothetical protein
MVRPFSRPYASFVILAQSFLNASLLGCAFNILIAKIMALSGQLSAYLAGVAATS